jgi:cell pole-organizing protein PopZ
MTESQSADPNLDEILASIRRIISEDGPAAAAAPALHAAGLNGQGPHVGHDADDVLVLTRRAPVESPAVAQPEPCAPELPSPAVALTDPEPEEDEVVVAPQTEAQAAAAFDKLSAVAKEPEPAPSPSSSLTISAPGRTLEDMVRELMRPMIKEWLDENLPSIVQTRVDQEIDRIARQRAR